MGVVASGPKRGVANASLFIVAGVSNAENGEKMPEPMRLVVHVIGDIDRHVRGEWEQGGSEQHVEMHPDTGASYKFTIFNDDPNHGYDYHLEVGAPDFSAETQGDANQHVDPLGSNESWLEVHIPAEAEPGSAPSAVIEIQPQQQ